MTAQIAPNDGDDYIDDKDKKTSVNEKSNSINDNNKPLHSEGQLTRQN